MAYTATQGVGTTFNSTLQSGEHSPGIMVRYGTSAAGTNVNETTPMPVIVYANTASIGTVILGAGENSVGLVGGHTVTISYELTRPADTAAYAIGDVISGSTAATTPSTLAGAARVSGGSGYITGLHVVTNLKSIVPELRIHFYNTSAVTMAVDNALYKELYSDLAAYIGHYDMPALQTCADTTNSDTSWADDIEVRLPFKCAATSLYPVLEARTAFTPSSGQKITVIANVEQN